MKENHLSTILEPSPNLKTVVERLKAEHDELKRELDDVQEKTSHMFALLGSDESTVLLQEIRNKLVLFMELLNEHDHWEEEEVLPALYHYVNKGKEPSFITSNWVLEEDHKEAERFVQSFLVAADSCMWMDSKKMRKAASLLSITCSVLSQHLLSEEETFFPLADQILSEP